MNTDDSSSSHRSLEQRLLHLLQALRDTHDTSARAELNTLLRENADARSTMARLMVDEQALISRLRDDSIVALLEPAPAVETALRTSPRWFAWRPLTAAAAGIVFGMFSASMVFGFGVARRSLERVVSLFQESFESGPAPLVKGMPQEVNLWSGDYSEIVETYEGVKPKDGTKMARVLRSDYDGKTSSKPSKQGDLMRVVDVRPFLREANGGEVVMTMSALFNAAPFPEAERHEGAVYLYALGQLGSTEESLLEDALAHSHGGCRSLDRDPATWQRASARLLLPPGTERVLLKVSFTPVPASGKNLSLLPDHITFAGHFVDDVRTSVNIRKSVPNQGSEALP
jgi:hypothetical protein